MFEDSASAVPSIWATVSSWLTPTVLFVLLNIMIGTIAISSSLGSSNKQQQNQEQDTSHQRQLLRSPSMLQRLKSINFHAYRSHEPHTVYQEDMHIHNSQEPFLTRSPSMLQRLKSINFHAYRSHEPHTVYQEDMHIHNSQEPFLTRSPSMLQRLKSIKLYSSQEDKAAHQENAPKVEENDEMSLDQVYSQHVTRTKSDTVPIAGELLPKLPKKMKKSASEMSAFSHFEESDVVETRRPATVREGKVSAVEADAEVDAKADDFINKFKKQLKLQRIDSIIRYKEMITRGTTAN